MDIQSKIAANYWFKKTKNAAIRTQSAAPVQTIGLSLTSEATLYLDKITQRKVVAEHTVLLGLFNALFSRYFEPDSYIYTTKTGPQSIGLLYAYQSTERRTLKDFLQLVSQECKELYQYADYGAAFQQGTDLAQYARLAFFIGPEVAHSNTLFSFALQVLRTAAGLQLNLHFQPDSTLSEAPAKHFLKTYGKWLCNLEQLIHTPIEALPLLSPEEEEQLIRGFNQTTVDFPGDHSLVQLFEAQVAATPDAIAVRFEEKSLTYAQLNRQANAFADYLRRNHAVQAHQMVAVQLEKSELLPVVLLGILKAGAAYVPVDQSYPADRITYILEECACTLNVTAAVLEAFRSCEADYVTANPPPLNQPNDLAYVMFTSGTTGRPKGVMVTHRNIIRLVKPCDYFPLQKGNVLLSTGSTSFDASTLEFFGTLLNGATLVLAATADLLDVRRLEQLIANRQVDSMWMTAAWFSQVVDERVELFQPIRQLAVGGDVVSPRHVARLYAEHPSIKVTNGYGPTECTTFATTYPIERRPYAAIPIGKPISNTQIYLLDAQLKPVPIGVPGQLFIGGAGVAKGYLNQPELTAEKFIPNPFVPGEYMYRSGDLAKWTADGTVVFLGRKDDQVKLRGFRIELGEIESCLLDFSPDMEQAVVLADKEKEVLRAFFTARTAIDSSALQQFLKQKLPPYMVPGTMQSLDRMPLTPNGKTDRKALAELPVELDSQAVLTPPETPIEAALVRIWEKVLGVRQLGVEDNFFDLGGHSLMVGQIINEIFRQLEATVTYGTFFQYPTIRALARQIQADAYIPIPKAPVADRYPLTTAQQRLWVLSQLEGGSEAYHISGVLRLNGTLDLGHFRTAFKALLAQHEILRTAFKTNAEGEVYQYILRPEDLQFDLEVRDVRQSSTEAIHVLLEAGHQEPFDLQEAPLLRATLLRRAQDEYLLSFVMHHIIGDGWSLELLVSEVIGLYNQLVATGQLQQPALPIQYKDYAVWLQTQLRRPAYREAETYWLSKFQGTIPTLDFPAYRKRPAVQTYRGRTIHRRFSANFTERLHAYARQHELTLFMVLMAGVKALLYRYTNQQDLIVGTPIAGRVHPDLEQQIGLYLNTLAIRTFIEEDFDFNALLQAEKQGLLEAYQHQNYPFDELVAQLNLKRDTSRSALFDVMVVLQNQAQLKTLGSSTTLDGIQMTPYPLPRTTAQFDLSFTFLEQEVLELELEFNTDIYEASQVEALFDHLENLLNKAIDDPHSSLKALDFLTASETQQLLDVFNPVPENYPEDQTITAIFESEVARRASAAAVIFGEQSLSYQQLNEKANQLAFFLRKNYNIRPDSLIGIQLDRSADLLVAILGVLKSGAAYVPIDINYPADRRDYIRRDSGCKAVIDRQLLNQFEAEAAHYPIQNPENINEPTDLAYVIYTSGTTGKPKGVQVAHRNVLSIHADWKRAYRLDTFQVNLLQLASVSFDVFVGDICRTLLSGGTMIMPSDAHKLNPEALYQLLEQHRISIFEGTPGLLLPLLDYIDRNEKDYSFLRLIIFGSDSINNTVFHSIKYKYEQAGIRVVNSYGVTEATIDSTYFDGDCPELQGPAPIGKPFSNTRIYLLNPARQLVPIGVFGQVYIGGAGVSRGYHRQPALTAARFVQIPQSETIVYDTGDLARWLPDGNLEFLGRADHQVKLRGYRIEPGEIENTIRTFSPALEQVLVCLKPVGGEENLVGYFVATQPLDKAELKRYLAEHLPEYMIPGFLVQLERFPLTPNGKLDRAQLPEITETDTIRQQYVAPQNETEAVLADIWKEILGFERIGTTDNFFELGGHSLKITKLKNLIARRLQVEPSFNELFIHSTIREQARLVAQSARQQFQAIAPVPKQEDYPLSAAQQRIWVLSQFEGANAAYNMPGVFQVEGPLQVSVLERALGSLIERHESLRTRFVQKASGELRQRVLSPETNGFRLSYEPVAWFHASETVLHTAVQELVCRPFALADDCLLRVAVYRVTAQRHLLIVVLHHIISDGWSIDLITNECFALYNAYAKGAENPLPALRIQYRDYAVWEQSPDHRQSLQEARGYWLQQFSGALPVLELPYRRQRPRQKSYAGAVFHFTFDAARSADFKAFCKSRQSTLFMGLTALVKVLLYRYTQQTDLIIGTPVAGRAHEDLRDQVGVFINTLALRTMLRPTDSFEQLLQQIQQETLQAYQHQQYPFDRLVEDLALPRNLGRNPLFDILVTLQNTDEAKAAQHRIDGLELKPYHQAGQWTSRFDLDLVFEETLHGLDLALIYDTALFDADFVERFCKQLLCLMDHSLAAPETPIYNLELLSPKEQAQLLEAPEKEAFPLEENTLLDYFRQQALRRPDAPAIADRHRQLSYEEVDRWTDRVAVYLRHTLADAEKAIGVVMDRGAETLLMLLGILKAGRAYIPLDPTFPVERLAYIVAHSGIKTLIQSDDYSLPDTEGLRSLSASTVLDAEVLAESDAANAGPAPTDTAYIIYTSGSTGNPKGVEIGHRSLLNFLLSMQQEPGLTALDTLYAVTTYSFDISILEFFGPLIAGGCVYIADNQTLADPALIIEELQELRPTVLQATPSFYQLLFHAGWTGDAELRVLCGGDLLSEALAARLLESCKELWNMYGPTETTIWSSLHQITRPEDAAVIGKPIARTTMYVLGAHLELLPAGAIGALYIGGAGLAKGYYRNPELTALRFPQSPFGTGCIYETGDLVRRQADGTFVFLGRNDNQVKIRGYRIELGEIESKLNLLPGIRQAVAVAKRSEDGQTQLVAYYTSEVEPEVAALRRQLAQWLPDYMIPAHFMAVPDFPLTPNKKIDRKALTNRTDTTIRMVQVAYRPPLTDTELQLASLWTQALHTERVGLDDDFFDLGGNSLSATRLVSSIRAAFDCPLSIDKVFEYPTIAQQAELIENLRLVSQQVPSDETTEFENFTL